MNEYKNIGNYYCNASSTAATLKNAPFSHAFTMKVDFSLGSGFQRQTYIEYNTQKKAVRFLNNGEWEPYVYFSDDETLLGKTVNCSNILTSIITDISQTDDINETCIRYVQGALLDGKTIYGFVITARAGTVLSQIIFGSFSGVSGIAVRGKSGSPIAWKEWKLL